MLDQVILAIGTDRFGPVLLDVMRRELSVRRVCVIRYRPGGAVEPFVAVGAVGAAGRTGAEADDSLSAQIDCYVGGYFARDPLLPLFAPARRREVAVRVVDADEMNDADYREQLFDRPGIAGKMAIVAREPDHAVSVSFYRDVDRGGFGREDLERSCGWRDLVAAAAQRHCELVGAHSAAGGDAWSPDDLDDLAACVTTIEPRSPLSAREAAVCARVARGYSNEGIALDLGISFHSVATYRRRAYAKLGISSQNELLAAILRRNRAPVGEDRETGAGPPAKTA